MKLNYFKNHSIKSIEPTGDSNLSDNGFDSKLIKINDFAFENDLVLGEDPDKLYKVIDIDGLNESLNEEIDKSSDCVLIVEGHLSHLCEGADKMIVLRLNPSILKNRLEERNYSESKIQENLEAEALAVCSAEAYEIYGDIRWNALLVQLILWNGFWNNFFIILLIFIFICLEP